MNYPEKLNAEVEGLLSMLAAGVRDVAMPPPPPAIEQQAVQQSPDPAAAVKVQFAQWDADLEALRAQERRAALLAANAMLANATPEPRLAALEDAPPRNEFRGRPAPIKRVSRKAHRQSQDARWGARYLSPAVYTYLPAK